MKLIFQIPSLIIIFLTLTMIVGSALPKSMLLPRIAIPLQRVLVGFCLLIVALRWPVRDFLPALAGDLVVMGLFILGLGRLVSEWRCGNLRISRGAWPYLFLCLPGLIYILFPALLDGAVLIRNWGPDIDAHLFSASFLKSGGTFYQLLETLKAASGSEIWWDFTAVPESPILKHYLHPDFRANVAVEVFLRSVRYGHAVLSVFISKWTSQPVWLGHLVVLAFALVCSPWVIFEAAMRNGFDRTSALLASFQVILGQTFVVMLCEGIVAQLMVTPLMFLLILNLRPILLSPLSILQTALIGLFATTLISSFGEGIQILATLCAVWIFLLIFFDRSQATWKILAVNLAGILLFSVLWGPGLFADFILWSIARMKISFAGGALHYDWNLFSLYFSLPYVDIQHFTSFQILFDTPFWVRIGEALAIGFLGIFCYFRRRNHLCQDLIAVSLVTLLFVVINHRYALWKTVALLQPLFLLSFWLVLRPYMGRRATKIMAVFGLILPSISSALILINYAHFGTRMYPAQMAERIVPDLNTPEKPFAIITPSDGAASYRLLALDRPFYWLDRGWQNNLPDFRIGGAIDLPIYLYFDCVAEGHSRCQTIKSNLGLPASTPRGFFKTSAYVRDAVNSDGRVNDQKLKDLILKVTGLPMSTPAEPEY